MPGSKHRATFRPSTEAKPRVIELWKLVDISFSPSIRTFEYQVTGVAVEGLVGVEYRITPRVSAFGDYKLSFSSNDADVKGGGTLETDVWTNHFILGLSLRFGAGGGTGSY